MLGFILYPCIPNELIRRLNIYCGIRSISKGVLSQRPGLSAWKKVGAATKEGITRECLGDPQVLKSLLGVDDEEDESNKSIQKVNELVVQALARAGHVVSGCKLLLMWRWREMR
jgi:hypothetical protein